MKEERIERKDLFEEIASWPKPAGAILGIIVIPLVSCYIALLPLALLFGHIRLLLDSGEVLLVTGLSLPACLLYVVRPQNLFLRWLPAIGLLVFQSYNIMTEKPMNEWIYGLPVYSWTVGTPILTAIFFVIYCRKVGLTSKTAKFD